MKIALLDRLMSDIAKRIPVACVTWLGSGRQQLVYRSDQIEDGVLAQAIDAGFKTDRSQTIQLKDEDVFIKVYNPPLRMVIIGAVHIAQALIPIAKQANYDIIVVDPRTAFASEQRFAGVPRDTRWPDEALADMVLDTRVALVALTHDPKIDDPALQIALKSDAFYIGALGSRRTHKTRMERLTSADFSLNELERIHAPIGADIGAIGPAEIAISIMAEVTATLRGKFNNGAAG